MKIRKTLLTILWITFSGFAFAQRVNIGVETGLNIARLAFAPASAFSTEQVLSKPSIAAGILLDAPVAKNISIETGLRYSRKGVRLTASYPNGSVEVQYKYNYIELPVFAKYTFKNFFAGVGPYFAAVAGASIKGITTDTTEKHKISVGSDPKKDNVKRMDVGLNIKAGYKLPMRLCFSAQYGLGLVNILPPTGLTGKNRVFCISVGYYFNKRSVAGTSKSTEK